MANPIKGRAAIPILEMSANDHHSSYLLAIFQCTCIPRRIETDMSLALINSVLEAFNKESTMEYIDRLAKIQKDREYPMHIIRSNTYPHVCIAMIQVSIRMLKRTTVTADKAFCRFYLLFLPYCLMLLVYLQQKICFRLICIVLGSKHKVPRMEQRIVILQQDINGIQDLEIDLDEDEENVICMAKNKSPPDIIPYRLPMAERVGCGTRCVL